MRRLVILLVIGTPLMMGQMCGAPVPGTTQKSGNGLKSGIYSGTLTCESTATYYGPNAPSTQRQTTTDPSFSLTITTNGVPVDFNGREVAMGSVVSTSAGPASIQGTVSSLSIDDGAVMVGTDANMSLTFTDQSNLILTGPSQEVMTQLDDESISYVDHTLIAGTKDDMTVMFDLRCTATAYTGSAGVAAEAARLQVNDDLREACEGFTPTDADITTLISSAESDRLTGVSYATELQTVLFYTCSGLSEYPEGQMICNRCGTAIVNQVYGK